MSQWSSNGAAAASSPKWGAETIGAGSGRTAIVANNTALFENVTHNAFVSKMTVGVFGVTALKIANTSSEGPRATTPGWAMRRAGQGPITAAAAISANGANFANGETALINGGSANAVLTITTNATGSPVSATVSNSGGLFTNTSQIVTSFRRERHLDTTGVPIRVASGSGYHNTDYIVVSNTNATVNGTATITTNSTGGFTNSDIVITNVGLFPNNQTNAGLVVAILAANGAASNGTGATVSANVITSTSGGFTYTLGGRAGRVHYETLVELSSITDSSEALP